MAIGEPRQDVQLVGQRDDRDLAPEAADQPADREQPEVAVVPQPPDVDQETADTGHDILQGGAATLVRAANRLARRRHRRRAGAAHEALARRAVERRPVGPLDHRLGSPERPHAAA